MKLAAHVVPNRPAEPQGIAEPAQLHLYLALTTCTEYEGGRPLRGTSAAIWHSIDRLQAEGGRAAEIRILERISTEVHRLGFALSGVDTEAEIAARRCIAALTEDWLGVARLIA
jgi:hypothetical protein